MKWSLSSHRMFRRCQRQYYFTYIAANHRAKSDYIRIEAYLQKQVKQLSAWKGSLIHQGIGEFVIPYLKQKRSIDWDSVINQTIKLARRQFEFSKLRRFREPGITKTSLKREYCIIAEHDRGEEIPNKTLNGIYNEIYTCFNNLASCKELILYIQKGDFYTSERFFFYPYDGVQVHIVTDLIFHRAYGYPSIIDWKIERDYSHGDHKLQLALYAWVLWNKNKDKWRIQKPEDIELYEVQLLEGNIVRHICDSIILEEVENFMFQSIHEIRSLCGDHKYKNQNIEDYEFARTPSTCLYCSFQRLCKEVNRCKFI